MNAHTRLSGIPDTALADAFLRALICKVAKTTDPNTKITVPTGIATVGEIERVLRNLNLIRKR